jgi:hypothetical protein
MNIKQFIEQMENSGVHPTRVVDMITDATKGTPIGARLAFAKCLSEIWQASVMYTLVHYRRTDVMVDAMDHISEQMKSRLIALTMNHPNLNPSQIDQVMVDILKTAQGFTEEFIDHTRTDGRPEGSFVGNLSGDAEADGS